MGGTNMKLNQNQIIQSRIREIKRKLLHQRNIHTRQLWRDHIAYLESQLV